MLVRQDHGVRLPHRLDGSSVPAARETLGAAIDAAEASGRVDVVVDLSAVEWVDVTGLGLLAAAHVRCERGGRRLVLVGPRPSLRRLLAVSGLRKVLHVS